MLLRLKFKQPSGFALVVTLSMMVLMVVLAAGLLSLSAMSLRGSSIDEAEEQARANARMALMIAIGELQHVMGPDQRITARAESLANHSAVQAEVSPNSARAWWVGAASSDPVERIGPEKKPVVWLISGLDPQATAASQLETSPFIEREVILFDERSIDLALTGGQPITAGSVPVTDPQSGEVTGAYAYFIDDNGMKAQLAAAHPELVNGQTSGGEPGTVIPGSYDVSILNGMDGMSGVPVDDYLKLNSINDLPFLGSNSADIARDKRMSYTTRSLGVLSNVKDGGLKKDLTIAFENHTTGSVSKNGSTYPSMPSYPVFDAAFPKTSDSDWGEYLLLDESKRGEFAAAGYIHWAMLRDYYNLKRYIRRENGYDCLAPVTVYETNMNGNLSGHDYPRGVVAPHQTGPAATTTSQHLGMPYGDYPVVRNQRGIQSEEYVEYYKHSPILPILAEMQYNTWLEKGPATPTDPEGTPKKPTTTEALITNVQVWVSHFNPYNIRMSFAGNRERFSFRANHLPQAWFWVPDSVVLDGNYKNADRIQDGHLKLQGLQTMNNSRAYKVTGVEHLGPGRAMMCSFEEDFEIVGHNSSQGMIYGTNVRDLVLEKAFRHWNVDGVLPPSLDWEMNFSDTGLISHGVAHEGGYTASQFLWGALPKDENGELLFDDLPPSQYNDNSKLCFSLRLRTTKETDNSIRPLIDANMRGFYFNSRWDTPLGLGGIAAYTTANSQDEPGMGRVPQMQTQANGKGYSYWGAEHGPFLGNDRVILFDVPREDLVSLGQLQHANVGRFGYEPSYVIGNSYANPRIPYDQWKETMTDTANERQKIDGPFDIYDASYLVNEQLWDSSIFTTIPQVADNYRDTDEAEPTSEHFASLLSREELLPNPRFIPYEPMGSSFDMITLQAEAAVNYNAGHLLVDGAFNVNSTSVDAWEAFLSSTYGMPYQRVDASGAVVGYETLDDGKVRFPRVQSVYGEEMTTEDPDEDYWVGFRALEQTEVRELAEAIVKEVKARGPFLTMGEFVNRKLEDGEVGHMGALQAALDKTVNKDPLTDFDSRATNPALPSGSNQAAGFPGQLLQGDILQALSPCMTVRSDTFTIRAYGESLSPATGEVRAKAWCEATVQRYPDPISSPSDESYLESLAQPSSPFGRQFRMTSFRWLNPKEI